MPDDKTPQEPTQSDVPVENAEAFTWPATDTNTSNETISAETAAPQAPVVPVTPGAVSSGTEVVGKNPKKKKVLIIAAIVAGALGLLGGGTAAAYAFWYQNPEKVVLEAVGSLFKQGASTHKISVDVKSEDTTVKVTIDAKVAENSAAQADVNAAIAYKDKDYKVTGSMISDKDGNIFFKVNDVKDLLEQFAGDSADFSAFDNVIKKIDSNWIKVSSDDLKSVSDEYSKTQKCTTDALKSFDDKAVSDEVLAVYKKNDFITIGDKIGSRTINGVGSLGYNVKLDEAKATSFYKALGDTKIGKALTACDSDFDFKPSTNKKDDADVAKSEVQIWSSRFGHKLTELNVTAKSDDDVTTKIVWNPTFAKDVTVTIPSKSVPISEVIKDVQNDYTSLYSSYYSSN